MRLLLILLLVPLSGCFGFTVEDDLEVAAPAPDPVIRTQVTVVDTFGGAIENATVTIATHNITFQSGSDPEGVIYNLTVGTASFRAVHPNYLERQIGLELTNESGDVKVQLTMSRNIDTWSLAERSTVRMTIDCSLGISACPGSDGSATGEATLGVRADMIALAYHQNASVDILIELLNDGGVVWSTNLNGPGPVAMVDFPELEADTLRVTATARDASVQTPVDVEYVVGRCLSPPDGWSLIDVNGWSPSVAVPCKL